MSYSHAGGKSERQRRGEEGWNGHSHSTTALSLVRISPLTWLSPSSHRHLLLCSLWAKPPGAKHQEPRQSLYCFSVWEMEECVCMWEGDRPTVRDTESKRTRVSLGKQEIANVRGVCVCVSVRERETEVWKSDGFSFVCILKERERDPQAAASSRYMQQEAVR